MSNPSPLIIPTDLPAIRQFIQDSVQLKPKLLKIDLLKWKFAIRCVLRGDNLLVRGDSGCGKTLLCTTLPTVFNRPFFYFNFGATQDARSTLIGNTHFKKNMGTYLAESLFVRAIQTPYAVIMMDEITRAHPDAHNILMSVLDKKQRYLRIDEHPDTPTIKVAEGVTFLGTANVGVQYTATRTIDRAFLDRWTILLIENLSYETEVELLTELFPDGDRTIIEAIAHVADETRMQMLSGNPKVNTIVSTRVTTEMMELIQDGFSLEEAAEVKIYPFFSEAGGVDSPRTFIKQKLQQYLVDDATKGKTTPFDPATDPNAGAQTPWS